jgi:hypothetical protein
MKAPVTVETGLMGGGRCWLAGEEARRRGDARAREPTPALAARVRQSTWGVMKRNGHIIRHIVYAVNLREAT